MEQLGLFDQVGWTLPPFVVLDVETTGFDEKVGNVIEVAAKRDDGETFQSLVCPPQLYLPPKITAITGITIELLNTAPPNTEVFPEFFEFVKGRVLVAHNAPFDRKWLIEEARRIGLNYRPDFIDTATIGRKLLPDIPHMAGKSRYTLENMNAYFGIVNESAHRAMSDVEATFELFIHHLWPLCRENDFNPINQVVASRRGRQAG